MTGLIRLKRDEVEGCMVKSFITFSPPRNFADAKFRVLLPQLRYFS